MARPVTSSEAQSKRTASVTFATLAEKQAAQAHAARKGQSLAGLLKLLLAADVAATPGPAAAPGA
ncbi:hypothetical protein BEN47_16710 [Hymenobacter lapidarius]|uniref:Uncharacterized protein n=1 Tax=Hymenobacter lapidarius TaxID=1908237 RepID=A0A1G1SZR8_9BACT|nr:hypothetical protein [Hymenobacter lapidarius]OGX84118.1 hypothetical protein BEN47_16710 [Hymenobacter lapidarius]